jgi:hypothetical protein
MKWTGYESRMGKQGVRDKSLVGNPEWIAALEVWCWEDSVKEMG